jgi:carboxymethylenebutenolidase
MTVNLVKSTFAAFALVAFAASAGAASAQDIKGKVMNLPATERTVQVEFFRAPGNAKRPTVLMLHGGAGWGDAGGRIENFEHYGSELAKKGYDAYMVWYYSDADAKVMADNKTRGGYAATRFPAWSKLVSDLTADVKKMPDSSGKVGLVGFSNGGNLSAHATPLDTNIDAAVIQYGGVSRVKGYEPKRYPPLLVMHGEADTRQPMALGKALVDQARALGGRVEWVTFPGENHGFAADLNKPAAADAFKHTVAFLNEVLKGAD